MDSSRTTLLMAGMGRKRTLATRLLTLPQTCRRGKPRWNASADGSMLMSYGALEFAYAEPIAAALVSNPEFRTWVLSRTRFEQRASGARLLHEEMLARRGKAANWWRSHYTHRCTCDGARNGSDQRGFRFPCSGVRRPHSDGMRRRLRSCLFTLQRSRGAALTDRRLVRHDQELVERESGGRRDFGNQRRKPVYALRDLVGPGLQ